MDGVPGARIHVEVVYRVRLKPATRSSLLTSPRMPFPVDTHRPLECQGGEETKGSVLLPETLGGNSRQHEERHETHVICHGCSGKGHVLKRCKKREQPGHGAAGQGKNARGPVPGSSAEVGGRSSVGKTEQSVPTGADGGIPGTAIQGAAGTTSGLDPV